MNLTSAQQQAIAARGNVLVVAGAGTGKTRTLVERCLNCLLDPESPASIDEILMVTFTEAAAAEMRQRIRARLEQESKQHPGDMRWQEQLALFESAHIGTLHSFCFQLVRQHFYELGLDPQLVVLAEDEARLLADETLDAVLQKHYAGRGPIAGAVQRLIQTHGRGSDRLVRGLVLRLHHYTQTRPDPAGWLQAQVETFASSEPVAWQQWLLEGIADWRARWRAQLETMPANAVAANCLAALRQLGEQPSRAEAALALEQIRAACEQCPRGKKTAWLEPLDALVKDAEFLASLASLPGEPPEARETPGEPERAAAVDPLLEDWDWVRPHMTTLLGLVQEFNDAFSDSKRELGMVDFHDLEQHALMLLWDSRARQPTQLAREWRRKLAFVFVDEYQDINAAQDKIIEALSREGAEANRFLVGDIKQSIYRFRLADPAIFQRYVRHWGEGAGCAVPLVENFRSREGILGFINSLFALVMRPEAGGVTYDEDAQLRFGAPHERQALSAAASPGPSVELHLRVKGRSSPPEQADETPDALTQVLDLEDAAKEARVVAQRLQELKSAALPIWDESAAGFRPVEWSDMAVLLRAPANKAESYAKEFSRLNVPLRIERGGFYQSLEVTDLLSLLQMLDNPLQDLPVLAVLHSPLVGLTVNELAAIRLAERQAHFWSALVKWEEARRHEQEADSIGTRQKVAAFLERFARWRRLARQLPLSRCLDAVLTETLYGAWLLTQPRGEQRYANVQRLLGLAQQFDQFQRQGLFRFLRFIEGQQLAESEPDVAPVSEENSVRLMSIHQSKGLEFPVVAVADLGKAFNVSDLRADIILDEEYGLCPQIKPPHTGKRYPSLPYWLARQRQNRELLGEELRLLYVAMTRARDRLILSASVSEAKFSRVWQGGSAPDPTAAASVEATRPDGQTGPATLLSARSCADWLGLWFALNRGLPGQVADQGEAGLLDWAVHDDMDPRGAAAATTTEAGGEVMPADSAVWRDLQRRLSWSYPFSAATRQPAKTSVSALRRHAAEQTDEDAVKLFEATEVRVEAGTTAQVAAAVAGPAFAEPRKEGTGAPLAPDAMRSRQPLARDAAAQIGDAHHAFLQRLSLDRVGSIDELKQEAQGLERAGSLTAEEGAMLDFEGLAAFWNSDLGRRVRSQARLVQRELAFTARFSPQELAVITGQRPMADLTDEFVVVQGVTDLAVVLPREIWLLDFKTDNVGADRLVERAKTYEPQLALYARALSQIYDRPVSECWLYFLARRSAVAVKAPAM